MTKKFYLELSLGPDGSEIPQAAKKRGPGRPKKQAPRVIPNKGMPKRRGRPKKDLDATPLDSICDIVNKFKAESTTSPIVKGKHELSRILKGRLKTDIESVGSGVMTRAQGKKLVGLIVSHHLEEMRTSDVFVTRDDFKLKECKDGPEFDEPKKKEWQAWQDYGSFVWVKDTGQHRIGCRWVLTTRRVFTKQQLVKILNQEVDKSGVPMVVKLKARLTPQGTHNQVPDRENIECESPTANKLNTRILLSRTAIYDWEIESFDVSAAFLQKLSIDDLEGIRKRELYVQPPKEFKREGYLMHMKKAAYGFADAPRRWIMTSDKILKEFGFKSSSGDPATYYFQTTDAKTGNVALRGIMCLHVDDGSCAGGKAFEKALRKYYEHFKTIPENGAETTVEYTGAEISKVGENMTTMSQQLYSAIVEESDYVLSPEGRKLADEKLTDVEVSALRQY